MTELKKPMSMAAAIWNIAKFFIGLAIFFAYYLYENLVLGPAEEAYMSPKDVR